MRTDYITKRDVKVPDKGPAALSRLLEKTQEGIHSGSGLDTVRLLHDSLAFLTEFFTSFAVGALQTVGPYSPAVKRLLEQDPSLDRSEQLLSQAFLDWKAHPHHLAYESLRETFYLTSRLQSSRYAPRRHTRWLGVEGRAVAGLERLARWSRRVDLVVSNNDEATAQSFIDVYTPVLWTWTDSLENFFKSWSVELVTSVDDGRIGLAGSASRSDVQLEFVPVVSIPGMKSRFASDGNGGVALDGFIPALSFTASTESAEVASAVPAVESSMEEGDLQLVFDPSSGDYVSPNDAPDENASAESVAVPSEDALEVPSPDELDVPSQDELDVLSPDELDVLSPDELDVPSPDELDVLSPDELDVPSPDELDVLSPDELDVPSPDELDVPSPDELDVLSPDELDVPSPDELDVLSPDELDVPSPASLASPQAALDSFSLDLSEPSAASSQEAPLPPVGETKSDEVSNGEVQEAMGVEETSRVSELDSSGSQAAVSPTPSRFEEAQLPPPENLGAPQVPDFSASAPEAAGFELPEPSPTTATPEPAGTASVPDFSTPVVADTSTPDFTEPVAEVPATPEPATPEPVAAEPAAPEATVAPDFAAPATPDFTEPVAEVPATPDFTAEPAVTEPAAPEATVAPDFTAPAIPDFTEPVAEVPATPDFTAEPAVSEPAAPEATVAPDFAAPAAPATPDFTAEPAVSEPAAPEATVAPDFAAPATPDFTEPVAEVPATPDFTAEPAVTEPAAPEPVAAEPAAAEPAAPEATVAPDFAAPATPDFTEPVAEVPATPDFTAEPAVTEPVAAEPAAAEPVETEPAAPEATVAPDFAAPATPDFTEPVAEVPATPDFTAEPVETEPAAPEATVAPDFAAPATPDFTEPVAEVPATPDFTAEPVVTEPAAPEPAVSEPAAPEATVAPDFAAPATPDLTAPAEPVAEVPATPDFTAEPAVTEPAAAEPVETEPAAPEATVAPDFAAPATPDFTEPVAEVPATPDFTAEPVVTEPAAPEPAVTEPVATEPAAPEPTVTPDFSTPVVPDFTVPGAAGAAVPTPQVPNFSLPQETVEVPLSELTQGTPDSVSQSVSPEQTVEFQPDLTAPASAPLFEPPVQLPEAATSGQDMFAVTDDMFSSAVDSSAPLFPVSGGAELSSVELHTNVGAEREMGASAEEILEDEYQFSADDGPAAPHWKGWSVDQREAVQEVCEFVVGQGESRIPQVYSQPVMEAIATGAQKIQVVLEKWCGKTRLAEGLSGELSDSPDQLTLLVSWEDTSTDGLAGTELLRFFYEIRRSKRTQPGQLVLPEPQTLTSLAISADRDGFAQAFQRLLGQIASLNKQPVLFLLDQPPEPVRKALTLDICGDVRFVCFLNPGDTLEALGPVVDLKGQFVAAGVELFGEAVKAYGSRPGATLFRLALASELVNADCSVPDSLSDVESVVVESEAVEPELLAVLSLEKQPISLDALDQWFLDADAVTDTITAFPSLFRLTKTRLSPVLGLAHSSVNTLVSEKLESVRGRVARKLLGWVVNQLGRTNIEKYGGLQVREIVFRNFLRLYRFAALSDDPAVLEWVLRNKDLQRRRVALTSHLERPGSRYGLQELLQLLVDLLNRLIDGGNCDDLRDELGWARSNLALNQLKLGLLPQASDNIALSCELFEALVNKEKQYEFRSALSTTHYRASRIFDATGEREHAMQYANDAVQGFVDLVEDRGRTELAPRLGIALAHRGSLLGKNGNTAGAKTDLQRAAKLLENVESDDPREMYRTLIEIQIELVSIFTNEGDLEVAVRESGKAVQLSTVAVEEKGLDDFQPLLATCHGLRAKSYQKKGELERALRDVSKSISLRNLSVDEGRLEQRFHLAKDLQLRAQINQLRGAEADAIRDLGQAVEFLKKVLAEGRGDAAPQLILCFQDRAVIQMAAGHAEAGIVDLTSALELLDQTDGDPQTRLVIMDGLLKAYLKTGRSEEALGVAQGLLAHYHAAQAWALYAGVQLIRGEVLERKGDLRQALEGYNQAASLVSQLLAQGQTDELLEQVAQAYLGVGSVELKLGKAAASSPQIKRALDVYTHLFQQRGKPGVLPQMLKAYALFAAANFSLGHSVESKQALKSGFDILSYMDANGGKGGVPSSRGFENEKGELHRQRAYVLLADGDAGAAFNDSEEAVRHFLATRQTIEGTHWKDELARTWVLRSQILFHLKDFAQAESSVQDAIAHFEEQLKEGRYECFSDLLSALSVRAENASRSGKIELVLEEYNRMLTITSSVANSSPDIDHEFEMAKIFEKRAKIYSSQGLLNEAFADFENVIKLYRSLVTQKGRSELAGELVRVYLERAEMTTKAGHGQHALGDLTEAINVAKALVGQGQVTAVAALAKALHQRADVLRGLGRGAEALQDLEGCIGFRSQLAQQSQDPDLIGELGKAFLAQGTLLVAANQVAKGAASLDQANAIFTNMVEVQGRKEYSSDLAQGLITRVSISGDKSDPALRQVLIKAVNLVTQQAKEGKPVGKDFTTECLRTVVDLLQREDFETVGSLIDSVLSLVETVVTDGRSEQDFVKLTDLLLAASAGLIDDRRTARRPHFLSLACVSCNREIQMFGKNSLPRLVYCLYELGQALERSKPPAVLNYVGSSFALLGELASQQQANEDFLRELKMMVSTWRSLPPQVPALANVSRHMLSQLLRLT